ncbi:MAG TPA: hypothetical protein PL105_03575 [Caldilineaceae bacterium]|nr:hypothetical protein [Caldilineaceae bacterium]
MARLMESGEALAKGMSWDVVVRDYFVPGLERARVTQAVSLRTPAAS